MGERSLTACIEEQLEILRPAAHGKLADWYDEGADPRALDVTKHVNGTEVVHQAWGYLMGVADALDVTVLTLLDDHGLSFDRARGFKVDAAKRQRIRKVR